MHAIRAKLCTQPAGDTPGISPDGVFADGIAKPIRCLDNFWEFKIIFFIAHRLVNS
jgi:hypothetical protein